MVVSNVHAYCDESGNTGANLLDDNQPLLVIGGWFVNDRLIEGAEQVVLEYIEVLSPKDNELKGIRLLKTAAGTQRVLNLIVQLHRGCSSICQFVEKRIILVGFIFNIFLKPRFNPLLPTSFEDYFDGKRKLMEAINALPDQVLAEFAEAYKTLDRSLLIASLHSITTALSLRLETRLADLMLGSLPYIDEIIAHNTGGRVHFDTLTMNTPNVASFHMFFQSLEHIGRMANIPKITLVHDQSRQFTNAFPRIFNEARDDAGHYSFEEGAYSVIYRGFESLQDFMFANSKDEPLLQAADVLVSAMYRHAVNVYKGTPSPPGLLDIARLILTEPATVPVLIRYSVSQRFADKLYDSVK